MNDHETINDQIAGALGDARGSYEQIMGRKICTTLGIDPAFQGHLTPLRNVSPKAADWLRTAVKAPAVDAEHATEILFALQL